MSEFFSWFLGEFLPPILPWVTALAIAIEALFWGALTIGVGWTGKKILARRRETR